jgi:dihydroorotate dehydrogenase electron transfer subunit
MPVLEKCVLTDHRQVAVDMYEVEFTSLSLASMSQPGQFVNIRVNDQYDPLLRRPISIYDIDRQAGKMTLLYKVVGREPEYCLLWIEKMLLM